jgi:hypothetical protein
MHTECTRARGVIEGGEPWSERPAACPCRRSVIPRGGYRLEDFVDDGRLADHVDGARRKSLSEGFRTTLVHPRDEIRETGAIYRALRFAGFPLTSAFTSAHGK